MPACLFCVPFLGRVTLKIDLKTPNYYLFTFKKIKLKGNGAMIKVENLKKVYGDIIAVDNISFEVTKGEIVGFLGPNGAGKTTTMKILTCFIGATSGNASIAGFDVEKQSFEVRSRVGYLPENAPLYHDMDVLSFLRFIAEIRGINGSVLAPRLEHITATCGLKSVIRRPIGQLSKGFRQRVGLAQAMIHDPDILILDEPTSGLDPNQIVEIRELIKNLGKEKTVVLSTHILPEVAATCGRVIIINEGKIVAKGTLSELASHSQEIVIAKVRGDRRAVETKLKAVPGADGVRFKEERNGLSTFEITPKKGTPAAEEVFRAVADGGFSLAELRTEGASLEDVFQRLTRSAS
jgi:ABC-2 type transport system ATP-binding protein